MLSDTGGSTPICRLRSGAGNLVTQYRFAEPRGEARPTSRSHAAPSRQLRRFRCGQLHERVREPPDEPDGPADVGFEARTRSRTRGGRALNGTNYGLPALVYEQHWHGSGDGLALSELGNRDDVRTAGIARASEGEFVDRDGYR